MASDGCELARDLVAALDRRPLLVAVTGASGETDRCRAAGFDHVFLNLVEPVVLTAVLARLDSAVLAT